MHIASAANRLDAVERLVTDHPDSVNITNARGQLPSDVAGCEAARDMVKPFKKAVNTIKAAIRFNFVGGGKKFVSPSKAALNAKFSRQPKEEGETPPPPA